MTRRLLMIIALSLAAVAARAGYQNVDATKQAAPQDAVDGDSVQQGKPASDNVDRRPARMMRKGHPQQINNRGGRFDQMNLDALEEVELTLTRPELPEGASVYAYTVHGGRINGTNVTTTLISKRGGELTFTFKVGEYFGNYPVVLRYAGREEIVNFWVNEAKPSHE